MRAPSHQLWQRHVFSSAGTVLTLRMLTKWLKPEGWSKLQRAQLWGCNEGMHLLRLLPAQDPHHRLGMCCVAALEM